MFLDCLKQGLKPGGEVFVVNGQMSSVIIEDYLVQAGFNIQGIQHFSHLFGVSHYPYISVHLTNEIPANLLSISYYRIMMPCGEHLAHQEISIFFGEIPDFLTNRLIHARA